MVYFHIRGSRRWGGWSDYVCVSDAENVNKAPKQFSGVEACRDIIIINFIYGTNEKS